MAHFNFFVSSTGEFIKGMVRTMGELIKTVLSILPVICGSSDSSTSYKNGMVGKVPLLKIQ